MTLYHQSLAFMLAPVSGCTSSYNKTAGAVFPISFRQTIYDLLRVAAMAIDTTMWAFLFHIRAMKGLQG